MTSDHPQAFRAELEKGERFHFGDNWRKFSARIDSPKIDEAKFALTQALGTKDLSTLTFLDAGSGSGLSSLAARRLGAKVHSFDYDPESVGCTKQLKDTHHPDDPDWIVETGSVLNPAYMEQLEEFDIVYAWGVLHHTGDMWVAIESAAKRVRPGGRFFIAIYNDQGWISGYWKRVKQLYNKGTLFRYLMITVHAPYLYGARVVSRAMTGCLKPGRGMSMWYDMLDWLGGLPFETATVRQLENFLSPMGFRIKNYHRVTKRHGCNELVFYRDGDGSSRA